MEGGQAEDFAQIKQWIRQFVSVYGHDAVTCFSRRRLNGVSLVRVLRAVEFGSVIKAQKIGNSTVDCKIAYLEEPETDSQIIVTVIVTAAIYYDLPKFVIDFVEEKLEGANGTTHAA